MILSEHVKTIKKMVVIYFQEMKVDISSQRLHSVL